MVIDFQRLKEKKELNLDDATTKYPPEFRPKLAVGREPFITVRQTKVREKLK
jgi:hypothetical protein